MKFMRNLKHNVFVFLVFSALIGCNTDGHVADYKSKIPNTSKAEIVVLDSLVNDTLDVDTILKNTSSFENRDTSLDSGIEYEKPFDSLHNLVKSPSSIYNKATLNKYIVGKWLVEKRIGNGEEKLGDQKVFAVYEEDSSFFMSAIHISGKWWISDTLLFQKIESPSKVSIDTSIIHVLNDTVLEVSEMQRNYKFIFKKVSK